jgi:hypothetical protein
MHVDLKTAAGGEAAPELAGSAASSMPMADDGAAPVAAHLAFLPTLRAAGGPRIEGWRTSVQRIDGVGQGEMVVRLVRARAPKVNAIADMLRALRPARDYGGEAG